MVRNSEGLADSGYYMDVSMFTPLKRYVVTEHNGTGLLNQDPTESDDTCVDFVDVITEHIDTPVKDLLEKPGK